MAADSREPARSGDTRSPLTARLAQAVADNPRVLVAAAAVEAARARSRAADRPLYNPEVGLDLETAENDSTALGLSQTFDWGDKQAARARVAELEVLRVQAELARVRHAVGVKLISRLSAYRTARAIKRIAQRRVELMERFAALAEQRRRAGDLGQVELNLARVALAEARLRQSQAAIQWINARHAFSSIVEANFAAWPELPLHEILLPETGFAPDRYLMRLPLIRARQARVAAAKAFIELRTRQTRPDPTLNLRGGREDEALLAGLSLSIPLYVRNDFSALVDAANAEVIQAERTARNTYRLARARLNATAARVRLSAKAWRDWRKVGEESLRAQLELLQRLWQVGELSAADYLMQTRQVLDTRASAMELRDQLGRAWADWLQASGEIRRWLSARH